uniref:Uncharacterized protein LOC105044207 isoform X2 n=1 Tax=Elaeis guineensis var. tenera TaxID=51953 RepID=A0A8N4F437_ELAGV|nr:uncharacterized protein LOC105044207 isoform X2 [Elaeis guineensis]
MSRTERSKEAHRRNSNEGTAARTRPLSFEEIMLRRKKKLTAGAEGASGSREPSVKHDAKGASDCAEPDEGYKSTRVLKDTAKGSSRRMEEVVSKRERDWLEGTSRKMEEVVSKREGDRLEGKEKGKLDYEANIKAKSSYSKRSGDRESKTERQSHYRSRTGYGLEADSEKEFEKKRPKDIVEKDKVKERDRKLKGEGKRKYHGHNDEKSRSEIDGSKLKKHDSGKSRDEYSERNDRKKEHSKAYYEDPRSKRRRSRSRENDQEREVSFSPRANKRSYHVRDYEESSFPSLKDKSRRKYSDGDKHRASGNGGYASGHHRKYGSGLGGYSPRKRRTEAAVRTPSPTIRSPEKKTATWDQPPPGANHTGFGSTLANFQSSTTPAIAKSQPTPSKETVSVVMSASVDSVQLTQATRPKRRLYIENLPPSASEKTVIDSLNDCLLSSGVNQIQGTSPCISCLINKEKCQALVEFLTPEDATAALSFDGRSLFGSVLKIRRPKDFVEAATGAQEKPMEEAKAISDVVKDSPQKIFIGGISKTLSSDMYVDHSVTQKACAGLNGMKLGGCVLTAVQAFPSAHVEENTESAPSYGIPMHAKPLLADSTKVLQLKNVFKREEFLLLSESELEETLEDVRLECGRFGTVKSVNIVRYTSTVETAPKASEPETIGGSKKIESTTSSPKSDSEEDGNIPVTNNANEPQDARDASEDRQNNHETSTKDLEKESAGFSPSDGVVFQDVQQLNEPSGDPRAELDDNVDAEREESGVENDMVPKSLSKLEVDTTIAEDAGLNSSAAKQEASRGDGEHMSMENVDPKTTVRDGANSSKGDDDCMPIDNANLSNAVDEAVDKTGVSNGDDNHQAQDLDVFEPGSVLVEFLRKEATCMAAHCLHGRTYSEQIVTAGYVPHDLYLARFPR